MDIDEPNAWGTLALRLWNALDEILPGLWVWTLASRLWNYPLVDLQGPMMPGAGRSLAVWLWIRPAAATPGLWLGLGLVAITMDDTAC